MTRFKSRPAPRQHRFSELLQKAPIEIQQIFFYDNHYREVTTRSSELQ